jgi:extradiol dioxygenase family protein
MLVLSRFECNSQRSRHVKHRKTHDVSYGRSIMDTSKEWYVDTLGFKVIKDDRLGDMHWVSLELPGGAISLHLTTADMQAAYKQLGEKGTSQMMTCMIRVQAPFD